MKKVIDTHVLNLQNQTSNYFYPDKSDISTELDNPRGLATMEMEQELTFVYKFYGVVKGKPRYRRILDQGFRNRAEALAALIKEIGQEAYDSECRSYIFFERIPEEATPELVMEL